MPKDKNNTATQHAVEAGEPGPSVATRAIVGSGIAATIMPMLALEQYHIGGLGEKALLALSALGLFTTVWRSWRAEPLRWDNTAVRTEANDANAPVSEQTPAPLSLEPAVY